VAELLPPGPQLGLFLTAALILAITPGPGVFYIVASSLEGGTRAGLLSVCGIAVGTLCHILFAAIGLTALIASLPQAFIALKYAGAVYLVYLGVRVFRVGASVAMRSPSRVSAGSLARVRQAIIVNVLNPKVGIFFSRIPSAVHRSSPRIGCGAIHSARLNAYCSGIHNRWPVCRSVVPSNALMG